MAAGFKSQSGTGDEINLHKVWNLFLRRWYFCLITLGLAVFLCKLYIRYTRPIYLATATIHIEDEANPTQGLGLLESLGNFSSNIQSEIRMLRSRSLMTRALKEMNVDAKYYLVGTIVTAEMHRDDTPFVVEYDTAGTVHYNKMFSLYYVGGNKYRLVYEAGIEPIEGIYYFGQEVEINDFKFRLRRRDTKRYKLTSGIEYKWEAIQWKSLLGRANAGLNVDQTGHMVPILKISHEDEVPRFTAQLVNKLLEVYVEQDKEIRTQAANQQLEFIRSQVDTMRQSVEEAERILQNFKRDNQFFGLEERFSQDMEKVKENEFKLAEYEIKARQIARLEEEMRAEDQTLSFPYSLEGIAEPILTDFIKSYNQIVKDLITARQSYKEGHPRLEEMNSQLLEFRASIQTSVASLRKKVDSEVNFYQGKVNESERELLSIPETQRQYLSLMREYEVQEKILSTLLEKQAEAQIAKASIVSPVRIVDAALIPKNPVFPNKLNVYIIGSGLGFITGILLILVVGMMNNRLNYREEIENISHTPIIGEVRRSNLGAQNKFPKLIVTENPKSSLAESIRAIRTNLQFIVPDKKSKTIAITSTVSGEGKSFIIINLAGIISMLDLKVVVLDLDLRKPKLHYTFDDPNTKGISTYLSGQHELDEVLRDTEFDNLSMITSGPIPPNPAELVQSQRMQDLLHRLHERFDYVLIDTPPIGLVTDGAVVIKQADVALYVIRAEYSKPNFATFPDRLVEENQINNLYIVFNSVAAKGRRYGNYGYRTYNYGGYYSDDPDRKRRWWQFWRKHKGSGRIGKLR